MVRSLNLSEVVVRLIPIKEAEAIANSQASWAVLFIILFLAMLYVARSILNNYATREVQLTEENKQREDKLYQLYETERMTSEAREEKLMIQLEKSNEIQERTSLAITEVQKELGKMNDRMEKIEKLERGR